MTRSVWLACSSSGASGSLLQSRRARAARASPPDSSRCRATAERRRLAFARLPHSAQLPHQRPQNQRRFHALALQSEQHAQRARRIAGGGRFARAGTRRSARCRRPTAAPDRRRSAAPLASKRQLLELLLARPARFPSTRSTISCAAAGVHLAARSACARARSHAGSAAGSTGQIGTHTPCFSTARTQGASLAFLSSLSVMIRHITSGGGCAREVGQLRRALVGLAARHAQFEQPPLREQRQRLARMAQLIPGEAAVDEEHACDPRIRPRARRRESASAASPTSSGSSPETR